jgi:hypothetical protein
MDRLFGVRGVAAARTCLLVGVVVWWMLGGVANATTVAAPTIGGTAQQGQTLSVTNAPPGPAIDTFTIADQWLVCTGASCSNGPTGPSFPLTAAEVGHTIEVTEIATDTSLIPSLPNPASATSGPTAVVVPAPPANTAAPTITGIAQVGQPLTANPGTWTGTAPITYTYQWTSGGLPVGTNSPNYTAAPTDIGKAISVVVTASNAGGSAAAVPSAPTAAVLPPPTGNIVAPTISGTPKQGQTLTVTQGIWSNGPTSITDQWEDCLGAACVPVPGQTGTTYTLGAGDVGHTIQVLETAANAAGPGLSAASGRTGIVTATSSTSVVAFSANAPTANQTVTLVATVTSNSGNANPAGSVSFLNGSNEIKGCTGMGVKGGQSSTVVCQAAFGAGTASISADYVPGSGSLVVGSSSAPTTLDVGKDSTSTSLAVTAKVARGRSATYSATVVLPVSNSGPAVPTGTVAFLDRGQAIPACANQPLANLTATCTVKYGSRGTHQISALYSGDANFGSSSSPARPVQIVKSAPAVTAFVKSTLQWTFFYHPTYTQVILFKAFGIVKGTIVELKCNGKGCPFDMTQVPNRGGDSINLLPEFHGHHLRAGTRFTVRLTHRHWVGKYYSFAMRGGRPPLIKLSCLAVGRNTPGVGC